MYFTQEPKGHKIPVTLGDMWQQDHAIAKARSTPSTELEIPVRFKYDGGKDHTGC